MPDYPYVSVIVPCYNEQGTIRLLLEALLRQTYPLNALEVVIADGMSADSTRQEIMRFCTEHPALKVAIIDNPQRIIPAGVNRAIRAAQGDFIVRLDAHSIPRTDYIEHCVNDLRAGRGANVGGVWEIRPGRDHWIAHSIAIAAAHPLGVGDAGYRIGALAGEVDTVPFGAFTRELIERIGYFDEKLLTNEDYEFNVRIRQAGGKVWLDPAIRSVYFARPNLTALWRQYWRYGYWKFQMLRRYPKTLRWRQALPPAFVASLLIGLVLGIFLPWAAWITAAVFAAYVLILFGAGVQQAWRRGNPRLAPGVPLAIAVMHFAWGSGFLLSLLKSLIPGSDAR